MEVEVEDKSLEMEVEIADHKSLEMEVEVESLFNYAMKGQWREFLEAYRNNPEALEAKITKSEDTVLHMAVYVEQTNFVKQLLKKIKKDVSMRILGSQDLKGNTCLHLAAELGNVEICSTIAKKNPNLIACRNFDGETPLFLAALHGKKAAFFCLHNVYRETKDEFDYAICRKSNGDTILHCTISGEYFDLAFQIICLYPNLADSVNENGVSALHILAKKPGCFRSSTRMEFFETIIYNCLIVDELKDETEFSFQEDTKIPNYPMNYETCMSFLHLSKNAVKLFSTKNGKAATDEENPSRKPTSKFEGAREEKKPYRYPPNWESTFRFSILMMKALLIIFGFGSSWIQKIQKKKEKHIWAKQMMNELVQRASSYKYDFTGKRPFAFRSDSGSRETLDNYMNTGNVVKGKTESPILIAAKTGVTEIVEKILETVPLAIHDLDSENKNVVLLAIENRQPHVYSLLTKRKFKGNALRQVDNDGNSALHLAATYRKHKPWRVPGAAMQMQWEYKWYKLVKGSMPPNFFARHNKKGQTAKHCFVSTHGALLKEGSKWLTKTSESCSVVAALVATVAFTTSTAIPGGPDQNTGVPLLKGRPSFNIFAITSLVALCSSVTALVLFLSILTSRFQEKDFAVDLPRKLLLGMTSLLTAIASVLVTFCAGHFFIVEDTLKYAIYPIYVATCLPVSFFALVQLPLYFDLLLSILRKVPQRSYKVFSH